jgi:thiosulfate/3-mercaptopyruvate sulfurtransferase
MPELPPQRTPRAIRASRASAAGAAAPPPQAPAVPTPLVSPEWLAAHLDDPPLRIFDVTIWLQTDPGTGRLSAESGRELFEDGHIPGSAFVNLGDLEDPQQPDLHMLPSAETFAHVMGAAGVGEGTHVVTYDAGAGMWATRLWWMLRVFGFDAVSVLDGGFRAWTAGGYPVSGDPPAYPPSQFEPRFRPELVASTPEVAVQVASGRAWLVNALSPEIFRGDPVPGYRRAGRIPSSVNVPYYTLLEPETGRFLSPGRIAEQFAAAGVTDTSKPITTYCGNGFAATVAAFGLALLGHADVAVFDGSLAEWASDPSRPLEGD